MGFDLYFAGARNNTTEVMLERECNRLLSYVNDQSELKLWLGYKADGYAGKLFVDSGAYSAHTKGTEVDVDGYIKYLNDNAGVFSCIAQLDTIPGKFGQPKTREELLTAPKLSWENYNYMRDRVIDKDNLLPIFHQGDDFKWLKTMLETTYQGSHIPYIGVSPANDVTVSKKVPWLQQVFGVISESSNRNVCTHAFGMTSLDLLETYPFTSADSTTWIQFARFGSIVVNKKNYIVSERLTDNPRHISHTPLVEKRLQHIAEERGFAWEDIIARVDTRCQFNVMSYKEWADNYEFKGREHYQKKLF